MALGHGPREDLFSQADVQDGLARLRIGEEYHEIDRVPGA